MSKFQSLIDAYGVSHQNKTNKLIHWICVPAIFLSIVGLISVIPFPWNISLFGSLNLNWAFVALIFAFACIFLCQHINAMEYPVWIYIGIFSVSWVFQFIGHHIEGKKPSFLQDIQFLLIGPAWLMHFIFKKLNVPY